MFWPCVLAIVRLSLDLWSNYTVSGVFLGGVWGGEIRSCLYNSGWHNLGLYKITIKPPFTLNQFTMSKIIIS